ncbi:progonadoliberin-2 [Protobothrops mucrosquamatus]|uniref:progonadoliberin-2 n=1 Tax=Protobothrops mucrosquamatus TaxID=103944 RepID=UPI0010FB478E|nr:progonadoliberin-2 [Protobothrops mucrosquamatus]
MASETGDVTFRRDRGAEDHIMVCQRSFLIFCILFSISIQLTRAQHWSHGWYPGGKREIAWPRNFEDSEESRLCDEGGCPYRKVPSDKVVTHLLLLNGEAPFNNLSCHVVK